MRTSSYAIHICDWSIGCYSVRTPSGKQGVHFEDNSMFGPSLVNMRNGDLSPMPEKHWFWRFYTPWVAAGRPTEGVLLSTPRGQLLRAVWPAEEPIP